ncbi:MAG: InlB B-repeat-containing protein [Clostridia bacterium]|nr:InlB B-repeat-containing protein [Clostridia bacterium]
MKRKYLISILAIVCLFMACIGLTSCGSVDFKVNFVVGENVYETVATNGNETIKMPSNPTKGGYEFEGWYWDNGKWEKPFTVNSLLNTPLAADMNVYAKFTHNEHAFEKESVIAPTCAEKGYTLKECECGETTKTDYVLTIEHTYSDFEIRTEATTYSTGIKERICTVCGYVDTEIIPKEQITIQFSPSGDFDFTFDYDYSTVTPINPSIPELPDFTQIKTDFNLSEKTITIKGSALSEDYYDDIITTIEGTLADNDIVIEDLGDYIIYIEDENGDLVPVPWTNEES